MELLIWLFFISEKMHPSKSQINNTFINFGQEHRSKSNYVEQNDSEMEAGAKSP
jgi:hypothetical protein